VPAADGVGVEVGASASADVGVRVDVGVAVLVRVGRVGAVAVTLGASVTLGAGRVPERSVEGRVADSLPSPAPQPLSHRTRPSTSPARTHALPAPRPRMRGATGRFLLAGTIRRDIVRDVRIEGHLRSNQGRRGSTPGMRCRHSSARDPPPASPEAGKNTVPHRARLHVPGQANLMPRDGRQRPTLMRPPIHSRIEVASGVPGAIAWVRWGYAGSGSPSRPCR
jgi:hypothetical protein